MNAVRAFMVQEGVRSLCVVENSYSFNIRNTMESEWNKHGEPQSTRKPI
jgi:hypothetical protein